MAAFYDARGNTYFVATPEEIGGFAELPHTAPEAAGTRERWARSAIERICGRLNFSDGTESGGAKRYRSDGLLVGPFPDEHAFALLIVNTDGTLAERSGNGLTIFSQCLVDTGRANRSDVIFLRIYHGAPGSPFVEARVEAGEREGRKGFWIDMGVPTYGLAAVGATPEHVGVSEFDGRIVARVFDLEKIEASWACSQFVNVGNPHCVTFLKSPNLLPSMGQLGSEKWLPRLSAIANSTGSAGMRGAGRPCKNGINLQWACVIGSDSIEARVFERGEGPTLSSGSSATAVAAAARKLGLLDAKAVNVRMPGGVAPVRFDECNGSLARVMLFGEAQQSNPPDQGF
jgi:diaminopimelate epimerase